MDKSICPERQTFPEGGEKMSRKDVVEQLNRFFTDAQKKGFMPRDEGRYIRTDEAINLSFGDILYSNLTPELKSIVLLGLETSGGIMMTKMVRRQPEVGENGHIDLELAGAETRLGGELVTYYDSQGESDHLYVGPSFKLMARGYPNLFDEFKSRPENVQERDALALVALARKAIGLGE